MPISVSPFLRKTDRLFFVKTGGKQQRSQEDAKLCQVSGELGHSASDMWWGSRTASQPSLGTSGHADVRASEESGFLQAVSRSAVCSSSGRGDELGNEAQYCWSVSQWNCLNREYLKSRSVSDRRGELEVSLRTWTKGFHEPWSALLMQFSQGITVAAVCFLAPSRLNCLWPLRSSGVSFAAQTQFSNCCKECFYCRTVA